MTITEENTREGYAGRNDYLICCNGKACKASLDAKDRTFGQAIVFLKAKGWMLRKEHESWLHYCSGCLAAQ